MNKKAVIGALVVVMAIAVPARANDTTYSPPKHALAGTVPFSSSYVLTVTSPTTLNAGGLAALDNGGVWTTVHIESVSRPAGVSAAAALALISVSAADQSILFTALNQPRNVTVSVTNASVPGEYQYLITWQKNDNVPSWGNGAAELILDLSEPLLTDTTVPTVYITAPTNGAASTYCPGATIAVTVNANDAESNVTAVSAVVNAAPIALSSFVPANNVSVSGSFIPSDIGSYTINASATSAGGTGNAVDPVVISVNYDLLWLPPLSLGKINKGGATVPIKFMIRDCADTVLDTRVRVKVFEGATELFDAVLGDGSDAVRLDEATGQYIANFQTAAGVHTYDVKVYFNAVQQGTKQFQTR